MKTRLPAVILALIVVQVICAGVFFVDVLRDVVELGGPDWGR